MRKIITFLILALLCQYESFAQSTDTMIYLPIPNASSVLTRVDVNGNGTVTPVFVNNSINGIVSRYTFTRFTPAFPDSRFQYLRDVYNIVVNNADGFSHDITTGFPTVVGTSMFITSPVIVGTFTPNDWPDSTGLWYVSPIYLDYIHAREAWGLPFAGTHGDTNTIIGITDTYFDLSHPDLNKKIAWVDTNVMPPFDISHGTQVAGLIAAATNNHIGYPSIGFNCRLGVSSLVFLDGELLKMSSKFSAKILNASWLTGTETPTLDLSSPPNFIRQCVYDEIYENGTIPCFGAGNGSATPWYYCYPASFDHNISVTNVMGGDCTWFDEVSWRGSGTNCDLHNYAGADTFSSLHHNNRVDIAAPGMNIGGITYDPGNSTPDLRLYVPSGLWGTSFATPQVAGVLGLMKSVEPCLSPYQLEYALKMGSRDIYGLSENAYLAGPTRWTGRLGAGALDAEGAVNFVRPTAGGLHCNDYNTQTFFISGIKMTTTCAPGHSVDSVKPKMIPVIDHGVTPYTYRWEPINGNTTTLDNPTSATPTIIASTWPHLAYWMLTVYDNSPIQKVANRIIRMPLKTDSFYDLAMRDSYLDMLDEPDSQTIVDPWNWWMIDYSQDLWNRQYDDGSTTPENAAYNGGATNYMYVRVANYGCADYDSSIEHAFLSVFWTRASTGEKWTGDWTGAAPFDSLGATGGFIGSTAGIPIPSLHPGDSFIFSVPWHPINPSLYKGQPKTTDICALARIWEKDMPYNGYHGMYAFEVPHTSENIINNNNIVTRNFADVLLGHSGTPPFITRRVYVGNTGIASQTFSVQMRTDKDIYKYFAGNLSEYMYVDMKLNDNLYAAWSGSGFKGNYAALNEDTHTVTYDPSTPLRLDSIVLDTGVAYYADLTFALRDSTAYIVDQIVGQKIHFCQFAYNGVGGKDSIYGIVSYGISINSDDTGAMRRSPATPTPAQTAQSINSYSVYPNPAFDMLNISYSGNRDTVVDVSLLDITGRLVKKQQGLFIRSGGAGTLNIANIIPGMYLVVIQDNKGYRQIYKITKIE